MSVDTTDLEKFGDEVTELHEELFERQMPKAGLVYGTQVQALARRLVPIDIGALKLSIVPSIRRQVGGAIIVEVGPTQKYGANVEFGTGPRRVAPATLMPWAKRKGANAYAVSAIIAKRGQKAQPYMLPAFEKTEGLQEKFISVAIAEAIRNIFTKRI